MSTLGPFAAVLFDLDGTLIDSTPAVERSWQQWAREYGLPPLDMTATHGIPSLVTVRRLLPPELVADAKARIDELEQSDVDGIVALPGAQEALAALGERVGVVTSGDALLASRRLQAAGLPVPAVFVTSDRVERGKPEPEPYLLGAQDFGVEPQACLVVEDAPPGVTSGVAAGCTVLGLATTTATPLPGVVATVRDLAAVTWRVEDGAVWADLGPLVS